MSFEIENYKLKHIVSLKDGLLDNYRFEIPIEGNNYSFKVDEVKTEIIELIDYFKYNEVKIAHGPLEKKLKDFTYGKSYNDLNEHEIYEIRFSKFKARIENKEYEFEITGVGPTALKVSLFLRYDIIENEDTSLERKLKQIILDDYGEIINDNKSYQDKLKELDKEYKEQESERERIREEVRKEQEEKERKRKELEEMLNSNKPKNNEKPFKMY